MIELSSPHYIDDILEVTMVVSELTAIQKIGSSDKGPAVETSFQGRIQQGVQATSKTEKAQEAKNETADMRSATNEKLERIAKAMSDYIRSIQRDLHIKIDDQTDKVVIQVISKSDGKIIRQVPPEELLKIAAKIEEMVGVLFDKSA